MKENYSRNTGAAEGNLQPYVGDRGPKDEKCAECEGGKKNNIPDL